MPGRLRRITVYETPGRFYLVGCNTSGAKFNVLKIDRIDSKALVTGEPECDYTKEEILELLATITEGNSVVYRSPPGKRSNAKGFPGLIERVSNAFGILGVVRFLEGYYLIVVTKANVVASFGYHSIYKIAEVAMISIAMDGISATSEEQRYVKLFQSVDLSTDFYFSYTYDLSRSLQENVLMANWKQDGSRLLNSDKKFVWNSFLLEPLRNNIISEKWFLEVVHGYVGQQLIDLPFTKLSLTLIGRRSAQYAGTRFLKRGANLKGSVANDVETEQMLWDVASSPNFSKGRFSSFVQRRGSVPLRWSQDPATRGVVGKPLILIDIHEPHAQTAAAHFRDLRKKYGNPIVVMNLVKRREKRRHESLLHEQFVKAINYLNQFLPQDEHICYLSFDVARCNKSSNVTTNVLTRLDEIALKAVQKHGWFQSFPLPSSHEYCPRLMLSDYVPSYSSDGSFILQQGVTRTNCVDCLDRTNVAQFGIGKVALACQMYSMGVLDQPYLSLQSEVSRVFEEIFDEHGDTLAWQYAGSQLVHSIKTYKKMAALQERSRDVIQTLSRYYNNTFGDYDKQAAINLFLGVFRPQISSSDHLWDLSTDYYLHFPTHAKVTTDYCAWMFDDDELDDYVFANCNIKRSEIGTESTRNSSRETYGCLTSSDDFRGFYRTFEMTVLENRVKAQIHADSRALSVFGINQEVLSNGQFMKLWKNVMFCLVFIRGCTDFENDNLKIKEPKDKTKEKGKKSQRESDDDDDEPEDVQRIEDVVEYEEAWTRFMGRGERQRSKEKEIVVDRQARPILATGLSFVKDLYALEKVELTVKQRAVYEKYVRNGGFKVNEEDWQQNKPTLLTDFHGLSGRQTSEKWRPAFFTTDDIFQTEMPEVSKTSLKFYQKSCDVVSHIPSKIDMATFSKYPAF